MGRGGKNQALDSPHQLLFGPRRGRPLSEETIARRKMFERKGEVIAYEANFEACREQLADGNAKVFSDLFATPTPEGFDEVEKKQIHEMIDTINSFYLMAIDPHDDSVAMIDSIDDLAGLIALNDRAYQMKLSINRLDMASSVAADYGQALANDLILSHLSIERDAVGSLPQIAYGQDFQDHLTFKGKILCGQKAYQAAGSLYRPGQRAVPQAGVTCQSCQLLYHEDNNKCDRLVPDDWLSLLFEQRLNIWGHGQGDLIGDRDQDPWERAENIFRKSTDLAKEEINQSFGIFTSYRLS